MTLRYLTTILLGTTAACVWSVSAQAADLLSPVPVIEQDQMLPAVSAVNGKWEFDPGFFSGSGMFRAAGSLSVPLGDRFGLQGDVMATLTGSGLVYGGALHAFTRDPSRYLAGITAGVVVAPGATLGAIGAEGELYLDRISLEGWAGLAAINYVDPAMTDLTGVFAFGDVAYYPTDDWRLTLGGSYVLGDAALHAGTEYLFRQFGTPLSLTADARLHTGGNYTLTVGLKGYFGGNDDQKSLIDRQRQDDPRNRAVDLFAGSGDLMFEEPAPPPPPLDTEAACIANEADTASWYWDPEWATCFPKM